ncbi:MAG: phosphoadenosine phosphosulfate reductase [Kiritimatiellia bacterium]|jgi:phosphoadenosine phosphosulfate reductase
MTNEELKTINAELSKKSPLEIVEWAMAQSNGQAIVSTNFRPFEGVILHIVSQVNPNIPVLWVDHGYNTRDTYLVAEKLTQQLGLNIHLYIPTRTAAHRDTLLGGIPSIEDEEKHNLFTDEVKLEPFQRGMAELKPTIWFTALRKVQNPNRETMDIATTSGEGLLKISPVFYFSDEEMEAYLAEHNLPDEKNYYDPTKVLENRECGLHLTQSGL